MNLSLTSSEYCTEVRSIADSIAQDALEQSEGDRSDADDLINDSLLHEAVDGHELVIYHAGNDTVLRHSSNDEAYRDCYSDADLGKLVAEKGLDANKTVMAFFALEADVREVLEDAMGEAEEAWKLAHPEPIEG